MTVPGGRDLTAVQSQDGFDVRLEWGPEGLAALAPVVDTVVIVDVLSFTTTVTVAVEAGAEVLPYRWASEGDPIAAESDLRDHAAANGARLAGRPRRLDAPSLSPSSLTGVAPGSRWVLPSANGSALSFAAVDHGRITVAASLRNATAVADHLARTGGTIGVVLSIGVLWGVVAVVPFLDVFVLNPWVIAMALGVSVATGVIFGVWPARRAAALSPIEALRYE